jgi:small subunit ribosomal protein S1
MNLYKPEGMLTKTKRNFELISSKEGLEFAQSNGIILESQAVLCDHNLDLHIDLPCGLKAIIPRNEVQYTRENEATKDIAILTRVGKQVCFKVIGFSDAHGGCTVILSRRAAQRECIDNYISTLSSGDILNARITHLESFGAFADIGCGNISLLSIDSISVSRISHPSARLNPGDTIYAVVKGIDESGRVYISTKELLGTWEENALCFSEGETVRGIVRSVENYGIFIELTPNLAGLAECREGVRAGQQATVYVKKIIPEKMKVKLSFIDAFDGESRGELRYFYHGSHMDRFLYSPEGAQRKIETIFT